VGGGGGGGGWGGGGVGGGEGGGCPHHPPHKKQNKKKKKQLFSREACIRSPARGSDAAAPLQQEGVDELLDEHGGVIFRWQGTCRKDVEWGTAGGVAETDIVAALGAFESIPGDGATHSRMGPPECGVDVSADW